MMNSIYKNISLAGADLPDDDYTTLVPHSKPVNTNSQTASKIQIVIDDKENNLTPVQKISHKKNNDRPKTTITAISRRRSTIEPDSLEYTRSVPSSPALTQNDKQRSNHHSKTPLDPVESEVKSVSSEYCSFSTNEQGNSLSSGTLEVRLKYDAKNSKMWVFVIKATLEMNQNISKQTLVQVHLTVLPNKRIRYRTRVKSINNAMFAEEFICKVSPESIQTQGIRFRLYTYERFKREKLLAEATVMFAMVNLDEDMCKIVPLERPYPSQDSDFSSRSHSRHDSVVRSRNNTINSLLPELEIGLAYDKNQSLLILEIGKGINFDMIPQGRPPDTFVQIILRNLNGEEIVSNRTAPRLAQHHPTYAERYPYNIQENYLEQITVVVSVINKRSDFNYGSISFGNDPSGSVQIAHWDSMLNNQGETITRWHTLLDK